MRLNLGGRQWQLNVYERVGYVEFNRVDDDIFGIFVIPQGAFVVDPITFWVEDALVGPSTAEMVFTNDVTGATAATTANLLGAPNTSTLIAPSGYYPEGYRVRLTVNKAGDPATVGSMRLIGSYVIDGRATEHQSEIRPL